MIQSSEDLPPWNFARIEKDDWTPHHQRYSDDQLSDDDRSLISPVLKPVKKVSVIKKHGKQILQSLDPEKLSSAKKSTQLLPNLNLFQKRLDLDLPAPKKPFRLKQNLPPLTTAKNNSQKQVASVKVSQFSFKSPPHDEQHSMHVKPQYITRP